MFESEPIEPLILLYSRPVESNKFRICLEEDPAKKVTGVVECVWLVGSASGGESGESPETPKATSRLRSSVDRSGE